MSLTANLRKNLAIITEKKEDWSPEDKKQVGEELFLLIQSREPKYASKITGMLLECGTERLQEILEDENALIKSINEALQVWKNYLNNETGNN
eukprot:UN01670